jgi:polysaccharide deacetylase family protein (PEP-CTERM system associated)
MKHVVLSMDVEEWYHLDYFDQTQCDTSQSMLDGLDRYLGILEEEDIRSTFFVLGSLAETIKSHVVGIARSRHEIASHGWSHQRPLTLTVDAFRDELERSKDVLENISGAEVAGFRAPCFSMDRERLDLVEAAGYRYDSSRIDFANHPLYGTLDMVGFEQERDAVFRRGDFREFEVSTLPMLSKRLPVSGGGYLRIVPWMLMGRLVKRYLGSANLYVFYIHPFELSDRSGPDLPPGVSTLRKARFRVGRKTVPEKLRRLIALLRENGFEFTTFRALCEQSTNV